MAGEADKTGSMLKSSLGGTTADSGDAMSWINKTAQGFCFPRELSTSMTLSIHFVPWCTAGRLYSISVSIRTGKIALSP